MNAWFPRMQRGHALIAVMLLNTAVLVVVIDVALSALFWIKDSRPVTIDMYDSVDDATLGALYPGRRRDEVAHLWLETVQPLTYQAFTEFHERPRAGTFVNVDAAGFRHVADQQPWPPDPARLNVFVFGGSTTFGYGVADDDTIASRLQPLLGARRADTAVYNFGRGYYYSTQERILFEQLLATGHVPAVAIFIDGLNDFCFETDDTEVSPRLTAALDAHAHVALVDWLATTAIGRAAEAVRSRLERRAPGDDSSAELAPEAIDRIIRRYLGNKRLIESASAAYGVTPVFVWQPVPMYRYDARDHLFAGRGFFGTTRVRGGYAAMAAFGREHPIAGNFVWLADVQESLHEALYVDIVHYAPRFAARLATLIDEASGARIAQARPPRL